MKNFINFFCVNFGKFYSSIDMYNNDGGKKFMKQTGALKAATLYFAS